MYVPYLFVVIIFICNYTGSATLLNLHVLVLHSYVENGVSRHQNVHILYYMMNLKIIALLFHFLTSYLTLQSKMADKRHLGISCIWEPF